jgi:hypothetical protein
MNTGPEEPSERFVDEAVKPIPPKDTWEELTVNELIDVKLLLEDKLWSFASNPVIAPVLKQGIKELTALIASRS